MSRLFCLEGDVTRIGEDFGGCLSVRISGGYSQEMRGSVMHFQQFYQMRIIRITLLKLQALKLSELDWKYLRNYWGRL